MDDKWSFLYEHSKYLFDNEVDRFNRLDNKANNYLRFTYLLIAIYGAIVKNIIDRYNSLDFFPI